MIRSLTRATLNCRSAPITERRRLGKMKAQYELSAFIVARSKDAPQYAKAPIPANILLLTLCNTNAATILTMIPPMAWGRRCTATESGESRWTFCMKRDSQKELVVKLINPSNTTTLIYYTISKRTHKESVRLETHECKVPVLPNMQRH